MTCLGQRRISGAKPGLIGLKQIASLPAGSRLAPRACQEICV